MSLKKFGWLILGFAMLASLLLVSTAAAAGTVWTKADTPLYALPDAGFPALLENGTQITLPAGIEVAPYSVREKWVGLSYESTVLTETVAGLWLPTDALTVVKPLKVVVMEAEDKLAKAQASLDTFLSENDAPPESIFSMAAYWRFNRDVARLEDKVAKAEVALEAAKAAVEAVKIVPPAPAAAQPAPAAPAPAAAQPAPAAPAPAAAPASCADLGATWDTLKGKSLVIDETCEVWISGDRATVNVNGVTSTPPDRWTLVVTGKKATISVTGVNFTKVHYHVGAVGAIDVNGRDGAGTNWYYDGTKIVDRPEVFRK
jgi:hypothetical protein